MKKAKFKKCLSLMIAVLFCSASSTIFAQSYRIDNDRTSNLSASPTLSFDEIIETGNAVVTNEYEAAVAQSKQPDQNFQLNGLTQSNKDKQKPYQIKKTISELSKKSVSELKNMNFNASQIEAIKSAEGKSPENISDSIALKASANFTMSLTKNSFSSSTAVATCNWAWQSAPLNAQTDTLGFGWSNGFAVNLNRTTMTVSYKDLNGSSKGSKTYNAKGIVQGCRFDFDQSYAPGALRSISSGKATVVVDNLNKGTYMEMVSAYSHNYFGIVPSISIGGGSVGIGISFSSGTDIMDDKYVRFP